MPPFEHGPYLQAALFCRHILRETDEVLSAIRIIDEITHTERGLNPPQEMPNTTFLVNTLITFKAGDAEGEYTLALRFNSPSGDTLEEQTYNFELKGGNHGHSIAFTFSFETSQEGIYWVDVILEGVLVTRMPLQIHYRRLVDESAEE